MKTLTISATGRNNFHDCRDINIRVKAEQYDPKNGNTIYLTTSQERRIVKHYCGIASCECGSRPDNLEYIGPNKAVLHV